MLYNFNLLTVMPFTTGEWRVMILDLWWLKFHKNNSNDNLLDYCYCPSSYLS